MKISQSIFFNRPEALARCNLILLALLLLPAFSCAKVGDPLPPLPSDVVLVGDLQILQSGTDTYLTFPHPVRELSEIEIYRLCAGDIEQINETDPVAVVPGSGIRTLSFLDRSFVPAPPGDNLSHPCVFAVRTINQRGKRSGFSNQVSWELSVLPPPPAGLKTGTSETEIRFEWQNPGDSKQEQGPTQPEFLVNLREVTRENAYVVSDFTFGSPLAFEVRTIDRSGGTILLSEPLALDSFVPEDVFPPRPPTGLIVVQMADRVQMTWDDNEEADLGGYHVYQAATGEEPRRISQLVTINRFVYELPSPGPGFTYTVTAVDKWGNESIPVGVAE